MTSFSHEPTASLVNLALARRGLAPDSHSHEDHPSSDDRVQVYSLARDFVALVVIAAVALSLLIVTPGLGS